MRDRNDPDRNAMKYRDNDFLLDLAHSPSSEKVMYNLNPAVIKSILSSMHQKEFIIHARYIRRKANSTEPGTNLHCMYVNLYIWCRHHYRQRFLTS